MWNGLIRWECWHTCWSQIVIPAFYGSFFALSFRIVSAFAIERAFYWIQAQPPKIANQYKKTHSQWQYSRYISWHTKTWFKNKILNSICVYLNKRTDTSENASAWFFSSNSLSASFCHNNINYKGLHTQVESSCFVYLVRHHISSSLGRQRGKTAWKTLFRDSMNVRKWLWGKPLSEPL